MGIISKLKSFIIKQPGVNYIGGSPWVDPPRASTQSLLEAYRTVGTLYAVVSRTATAVGEAKWRLYKVDASGKRSEIINHELIRLLRYVNPFHTGNDLFELTQMHLDLVGRAFWVLNFNKGGKPAEIWTVEPHKVEIIADPVKFIAGYKVRNGGKEKILDSKDVIYFSYPDPLSPYGGASPAMAASNDIDVERFTRIWQKRFFYNNAIPPAILSLIGADDEELKRFKEEWTKNYGGFGKAHKVAFVNEDIKYTPTSMTQKEMDFWRSDKANRDRLLLGLGGMPLSVMGISENVNRANAEAGEFLFTRWVVRPRLVKIREKLNEQLVPRFGKNLELDFDEPVPETKEMLIRQAEAGIAKGFLTVNEARQILGYDAIPNGNVLLIPLNLVPQPIKGELSKPPPEKPLPEDGTQLMKPPRKSLFKEEQEKEFFWRVYADNAEIWEGKLVPRLRDMFARQEKEVLGKLSPNINPDKVLNQTNAKKAYKEATKPILLAQLRESIKNGLDLIKPDNPHKQDEPISEGALRWLDTRIGWAAAEVGKQTAEMLARTLKAGFEAGESIDDIAERVKDVFGICSDSRAIKIARTETIMASNEGALLGYEESEVVEKAEFYAALDERVCEDCMDMHGEIMDLADSHGVIPIHPDCRCVWLPIV